MTMPSKNTAQQTSKQPQINVVQQQKQQCTTADRKEFIDPAPPRSKPLNGSKAIAAYCGISIHTLMQWIFREDCPATQIGGVWVSDTLLIDKWRASRIEEDTSRRVAERDPAETGKRRRW